MWPSQNNWTLHKGWNLLSIKSNRPKKGPLLSFIGMQHVSSFPNKRKKITFTNIGENKLARCGNPLGPKLREFWNFKKSNQNSTTTHIVEIESLVEPLNIAPILKIKDHYFHLFAHSPATVVYIKVRRPSFPRFWKNHP